MLRPNHGPPRAFLPPQPFELAIGDALVIVAQLGNVVGIGLVCCRLRLRAEGGQREPDAVAAGLAVDEEPLLAVNANAGSAAGALWRQSSALI